LSNGISASPSIWPKRRDRVTLALKITQAIKAPPVLVFDAWLKPAMIRQWLFKSPHHRIVRIDIDPRVGGGFSVLEHADGEQIDHFGTYDIIDRPHCLVFSLEVPSHFEGASRVSVEIAATPDGSMLTLTQSGVEPEKTEGSWRMMLAQLARVLEGQF
jgi:uncharacterized protein YndB with AHSA1/START domain